MANPDTSPKNCEFTYEDLAKRAQHFLADRPVEALFLEFGDSALIFRVRWWLDSYADTRRMFDKVNTALYNALNSAGIEIPFPQVTVHHPGLRNKSGGLK